MSGTTITSQRFIGIDPGVHGAIAVMDGDGRLDRIIGIPANFGILFEGVGGALWDLAPDSVFAIEKPQPIPKQSAQGIATFWRNWGFMAGVIQTRGYSLLTPTPQEWKRTVFFGTPEGRGPLDKVASKLLALRKFPEADLGKRASQDRAEAVLLAMYAMTWMRVAGKP